MYFIDSLSPYLLTALSPSKYRDGYPHHQAGPDKEALSDCASEWHHQGKKVLQPTCERPPQEQRSNHGRSRSHQLQYELGGSGSGCACDTYRQVGLTPQREVSGRPYLTASWQYVSRLSILLHITSQPRHSIRQSFTPFSSYPRRSSPRSPAPDAFKRLEKPSPLAVVLHPAASIFRVPAGPAPRLLCTLCRNHTISDPRTLLCPA